MRRDTNDTAADLKRIQIKPAFAITKKMLKSITLSKKNQCTIKFVFS